MNIFSRKRTNQRGDTIVEVLIAAAVISSVIVGAYTVSQRSSIAVRDSQEQSESSQVLQAQVELVRSLALVQPSTGPVFATSPKYFCIDATNASSPVINRLPLLGNNALPPALGDDDFDTNYSSGTGACKNVQGRYIVAASYDATSSVFTFYSRWDKIGGGRNQETLSYRIRSGLVTVAPPTGSIGNADVGITGCSTDASGACVGGPPPPIYYWGSYFANKTTYVGIAPTGCKWVFSDGVGGYTNSFCDAGDRLPVHNWAIPAGTSAYPADCNKNSVSVTLTMYFPGIESTKTYTDKVPHCY